MGRASPRVCLALAAAAFAACVAENEPVPPVEVTEPEELGALGTLVDSAARAFTADGPDHVALADSYAARWTANRLELTPVDVRDGAAVEGPPLHLATTSARAGARTLAVVPRGVAVGADGELRVDRGELVERIHGRRDGVEQSWELAAAPGAGDLVVRVAATGLALVAEDDAGLHFAAPDGLGFVYSHGTWIEATGAEHPVDAAWIDGAIELRVPADVVAASAFPAVLDPTVDVERAVDTPLAGSPTGALARLPDVAFSGAQYLVVWEDARASAGTDLYGARLSTTGAVLDPTGIKIAATAGREATPAVAFVNGQYLVVWQESGTLRAARISTAGAIAPLAFVGLPVAPVRPRLAVRGTEALLVFEAAANIHAARFTGAAFAAAFPVAATTTAEREPAVAANPAGDYLVAWSEGDTYPDVRGQLVTATGAVTGAAFSISAAPAGQVQPAVGFSAGSFVVVWSEQRRDLYAARVTPAAVVLDTRVVDAVVVGGVPLVAAPGTQRYPRMACAVACLLTWENRSSATTGDDVHAVRLAGDLTLGATIAVSEATRLQRKPAVTIAGTGHMVVWHDNRDGGADTVYGARLSATGAVLDPAGILAARGYNRQLTPTVARGPDNWLVTWGDSRAAGNNILGARVNNGGQLQDNPALSISTAAAQQGTPALAASGVGSAAAYVVAWSDHRGTDRDIYAARVQSSGTVVDVAGFAVATFARDQVEPAIASNNAGRFLVVWQDHRTTGNRIDVHGAVITTAGTVAVADFTISTAAGDQLRPRVAWDPTSQAFLVVWADVNNGVRDVYAARVTAAGAVLDPTGVPIAAGTGGQFEPDLAFGFDRFLVAWRDGRSDAGDIYATRVRITGTGITVDDPNGLPIAVQARKQRQPAVAFLERGTTRVFGIVWADERNVATASDIYGRMITPATGAGFGAEYVVSATANHESAPALSPLRTNGNPRAIIVYQALVPGLPQERVFARRITYDEI